MIPLESDLQISVTGWDWLLDTLIPVFTFPCVFCLLGNLRELSPVSGLLVAQTELALEHIVTQGKQKGSPVVRGL